jgi:hypothetical protein
MEKWLFLNRVDAVAARFSIGHCVELSANVFSRAAEAEVSFADFTSAAAKAAFNG